MLKERVPILDGLEVSENGRISRVRTRETPLGTLLLRSCCSASLVRGLRVADGLRAFARLPEREHRLLLALAGRSDSMLTLAYTARGEIVGQATLAPIEGWWKGLDKAYEGAVEVSAGWRELGIAHELLALALEFEPLEEYLILGLGLYWHWDMEGLGLSRFQYREMIANLFAAHGFVEYLTSEPNIRMDPANILLARLGSRLNRADMNQFFQCLFKSDTLPGL